jgi:hypothetical protein
MEIWPAFLYIRCARVEFRWRGTLVDRIHYGKNVRKAVYGYVDLVDIYQDILDFSNVWKYNPCCPQRCVFYNENETRYPLSFIMMCPEFFHGY